MTQNKNTNDLVTLVQREKISGCDWHDTEKTSCCLKEEGSYFVKHPLQVIADDIVANLDRIGGYTTHVSEIVDALATFTKMKFTSCEDEKPDAVLESLNRDDPDGYTPCYDTYSLWFIDQYSVEYVYTVQWAQKDELCYFAYENFLCPHKGMPTCQRLYTPLRASLAEAEEDFENLKLHDKYRSVKELGITSKNYINHEWLKDNLYAADILKKHPELDTDQYFEILIDSHLESLKKALLEQRTLTIQMNDFIDEVHQHSLWYGQNGTCLASIKHKGYDLDIYVSGDVRFDGYFNGQNIRFKDTGNHGQFYEILHSYLKNDKDLEDYQKKHPGAFIETNWFEVYISLDEEGLIAGPIALDADFLTDAIGEAINNLDDFLSFDEENYHVGKPSTINEIAQICIEGDNVPLSFAKKIVALLSGITDGDVDFDPHPDSITIQINFPIVDNTEENKNDN